MSTTKTKKAPKAKAEVKAEPPVIYFDAKDGKPVLPEPKDPVIERLDRIIALLEAPLTTQEKGLDLAGNPWWAKFLDKG